MLLADFSHLPSSTLIEERKANLVGNNGNARFQHHIQVRRIEVGQAKMLDEPFLPQFLQIEQIIPPRRIGIVPGMVLQ